MCLGTGGGFLNILDKYQGFVNSTQWIASKGLDRDLTASTCLPSSSNSTNSTSTNGTVGLNSTAPQNCTILPSQNTNSTFMSIQPWYTNVFSSAFNNSDFVSFAGYNNTGYQIDTFDMVTGALVNSATLPNTQCLSGSDGNTNTALYACILSNEL
jgi:hypothetical protein